MVLTNKFFKQLIFTAVLVFPISSHAINDNCSKTYPNPELVIVKEGEKNGNVQLYAIKVPNSGSFSEEMFRLAPELPPCGYNTNASRTWIDIYDDQDNRLYGYCGFPSLQGLNAMRFGIKDGNPTKGVYIEIIDRACNKEYKSKITPLPK